MEARKIKLPLSVEDVRVLRVSDFVLLTGQVVCGRDRFHRFLFHERPRKEDLPFSLEGAVLYHTGPIVKDGKIIAAGPTTSQRMDMYEPWVIGHYGLRGVMGKGGMGPKTVEAMKEHGCIYLQTIGGAAVYLADRIKGLISTWKAEEFGAAEAALIIEVEDFPAVVTIDSHGKSLHEEVLKESAEMLKRLIGQAGGL